MLQQSPMHAYLPVKDVTRARRFYEQTLGFRPKAVRDTGVIYEFGGHTSISMMRKWLF